jgi:hypothetical protein
MVDRFHFQDIDKSMDYNKQVKNSKIVYIDIGTHFAQEYQSIFGSQKYFFTKIVHMGIRRLIGFYLLQRGERFSFGNLKELISQRRNLRKKKDCFISFFVEANPRVIQNSGIYKNADGVFNCALTGEKEFSLVNLYLANSDALSQGSSIFLSKHNVSVSDAIPTLGVPTDLFFKSLQELIEHSVFEYSVILRLNCEGVEDDVIYSAHKVFSNKLVLVMGSLKDVQGCKGDAAYEALQKYLKINKLPFVFFSSAITSWVQAHKSINKVSMKWFE